MFGVERTDRVVDGLPVGEVDVPLGAATALAGPQDDSSSYAASNSGREASTSATTGSIHSGATPPSFEGEPQPTAQRLGKTSTLLGVESHLARHSVGEEQHHRTRAPTQRAGRQYPSP